MDERETPINGQERRPSKLRAAGGRALRGAEERVLWPVEDGIRAVLGAIVRPLEWLVWVLQRGLIWPLQDRLDGLGRPARAAVAVSSVVALVALVAIGVGALGPGSETRSEPASELVVEPTPALAAAPAATPVPEAAPETLEGANPVFKPGKRKPAGKGDGNDSGDGPAPSAEKQAAAVDGSASGSAATDTISSSPAAPGPAAASSSAGVEESGRPAGPKALAVAHEFADAFVLYETGSPRSEIRKGFQASATRELTRSLLRRPPRLPANAEVPKAKVVNVVAGPSHGGVYPVSVSLLRIGLTSELRLEMELLDGKRWRVANVLG